MDEQTLHRWLTAENRGRDEDAEQLLFGLFRALPEAAPVAGFADRVLIAAGVISSWRMRAVVTGGLLAAGLAAAFLLPLAIGLVTRIAPGDVLGLAASGVTAVAAAVDELVVVWHFLARLRETLWLVISTPPVALTLLTMAAVSTLAGRWLVELLSLHRSPGYA
ncbi:MAG: hypothetical protein V3T72_15930 [Thermoanaerobaculia bacterium]